MQKRQQLNLTHGLLIPFVSLPDDHKEAAIRSCESDDFQDSKIKLQQLRNNILALCRLAESMEAKAKKYFAIAVLLLVAAVAVWQAAAVAIAIPVVGLIVAAALYVVAFALFTAALQFLIMAVASLVKTIRIREQMTEMSSAFMAVVENVMNACSEYC